MGRDLGRSVGGWPLKGESGLAKLETSNKETSVISASTYTILILGLGILILGDSVLIICTSREIVYEMDKMDAGRVMRAIQMLVLILILILILFMMRLSERCLFNRGVERENLEKLKEGVEGLGEVKRGLARFLESELVKDEAFRPEPFDKDEGGLWFSFQVKGRRFEGMAGIGLLLLLAAVLAAVPWVVGLARKCGQRKRIRSLAQVKYTTSIAV